MHFPVVVVLFDMIMHSNLTPMKSRGQGNLVTLAKGHLSFVCQHFQRTSQKLTGPNLIKFHMQPPNKGQNKVYRVSQKNVDLF